ncbi:MAG: Ig-like domain-containing protein [Clostridia bacterium]|nr:Ig-like domain-containing protein [Clostridia bacterium]
MKKLMMSAVLLLPLVVLMILLVSGSIIGKTTHLYVEGLSFSNPGTLVLVMDDENNPPSEQLEIRVNPSAATNKQLKYSSDKESVVTVSDDGVVTAVDYGQATITVTSVENDAISITRDVLVTDNKIHRLDFTEYPTRIYNSTVSDLKPQLLVNVFPNVYDESVGIPSYVFEFKSSDTNVLRVAQDGVLTPLGVGEATITVSLKDDSSVKPVITQTIKVINPVESITFVKGGDGAAVITASAEAVFPSVKLNSGADEKIEYTSSNPSIATVDETGHICFVNAGRVTITATASDGLGNVKSISKEYTCTKDYYLGNLFPQDRYTVDFDEIMASGGILPISISENPEGAKQEIIEVKFSRDGVVTFDYQTKKFILVGNEKELGEVFVTIRARKYSNENGTIQEFNTDGCLINIERNVQSIEVNFEKESDKVVNFPTVNIMEDFAEHIKAIKVSPTVHTNKFSYEVISGDATVDADGILRFTSPSTVTVAITAINNTSNPASASLTIAYSKIEAGDKRLEYDGVENQQKNLTLNIYEEDNKEKGVIVFTSLPDGVTTADLNYTIISGKDILGLEKDEEDGTIKIVPLKGGYGTVEITANISGKSGRATIPGWLLFM